MAKLTPAEIKSQIDALDGSLADLEGHAAALALEAAEGNEKAAAEIGKVRSEIEAMRGDRQILSSALQTAQERSESERAAEEARRQEEAREALGGDVGRLTATAAKVDDAIADLKSLLAELTDAEASARDHARVVGGVLSSARVGQSGASAHAVSILTNMTSGLDRRIHIRPVVDFVEAGWIEVTAMKETADVD